ncbi:MAG: FAD-binding protein, partial [Nitrospinota bacterium]
ESKAVILATGGAGEVFKYNVTPPDMTGDGYRLALQKGVSLFDMEFVQFYPISIVEPGVPHWYLPYWYFFENGALLHNIKGEDVLVREGFTKIEEITRDKLARACGQDEVLLLDCTRMTDDVWKQHDFLAFKNEMLRHGFDPGDKPFKVTPTGYYFMGGIKIDASCRTSVPGLYAAGEVVGGIHGANRLGSNEFPAALVFGAIAGKSASEYTLTIPKMRIPADSVNSSREKIRQCLKAERTKVGHPVAVRAKIQETMWDYAIWVRSREGLERALKKLKNIKSEQMSSSYARTFSELKRLLENEALMDTAEMICWAAWMREESRGSHFRVDYPSEDPVWERNIFSTMTGNEVNLQLNSGEVSVHSGSRAP